MFLLLALPKSNAKMDQNLRVILEKMATVVLHLPSLH